MVTWLLPNTRCNRMHYVVGYLAGVLTVALIPVGALLFPDWLGLGGWGSLLGCGCSFITFCFWLIQTVRRLRDADRGVWWVIPMTAVGFGVPFAVLLLGWLFAIAVAPESVEAASVLSIPSVLVSFITLLPPFVFRGTSGENRFGLPQA